MRRLLHIVWWLILLHLAEISIWGLFYLWRGCLPNVEAAFYFSGVTYTTLGYGDVVLVKPWRMLAPIEGLVGVIMCGLSTGYFFVVVSRTTNGSPFKPPTFPSQKKHNLRNRRFGTLETILATLVGRRGSQCRGVMRQTWIKSDR